MKRDPSFIFRLIMMFGDALAIVFSFAFAYFIRTNLDSRPYYFTAAPLDFTITILFLIPVWWLILSLLGLYENSIILKQNHFHEISRLFTASCIGMMSIITFDFFYRDTLFPVRPIALAAAVLCFFSLTLIRSLLRAIRLRLLIRDNRGFINILIIGNSAATTRLINHFNNFPEDGYKVVAIVAKNEFIPTFARDKKFTNLRDAVEVTQPDAIFQTDEKKTDSVYSESIHAHAIYYFVPPDTTLSSRLGSLMLIGNTPTIRINVSPLSRESARTIKRLSDIIMSSLLIIILMPLLIIIWLIVKLSDLKSPAFFSTIRLSRFNEKVRIYKFRTMKPAYSGMSPEKAFEKMASQGIITKAEAAEISKTYRENGDFLDNDPRVTRIGKFLRKTSLDELPQLYNVLMGDISLVGPRALVPGELKNYGDRSLLLSIKSGLTGLAQVSGRRDLSFEERRTLDLYYIQNWSLALDFQIILRTISAVLTHKGAK
ncbi:MAG: exopolysaccharide biosynthesis polyprenyl glycosylphosphotransferase [Candidatus Saccharibacteria bacterium]|nr:exopolysaccharide biosynthesis polyprenyl glycosylphosphotransferase [Candidatus Saccharibacteria bacterium]